MASGGVKKRERMADRRYDELYAAAYALEVFGVTDRDIEALESDHKMRGLDEQYQVEAGERRLKILKAVKLALEGR